MPETILKRIKKISLVIFSSLASVFLVLLIIWFISLNNVSGNLLQAFVLPISTFYPPGYGEIEYFIPFFLPIGALIVLAVSLGRNISLRKKTFQPFKFRRFILIIILIILFLGSAVFAITFPGVFTSRDIILQEFILVLWFSYFVFLYYFWFFLLYTTGRVIYNIISGTSGVFVSFKIFLAQEVYNSNFFILGSVCMLPLLPLMMGIMNFIAYFGY